MFETSLLFNNIGEGEPSSKPQLSWSILKRLVLPLLLLSGLVSVAWGTWLYYTIPTTDISVESVFSDADQTSADNILYVDISGAVANPGIYPVSDGERVAKVVEAAGGLSAGVDSAYVHSTLNLSARLEDEQKIYIPFESDGNSDTETSTDQIENTNSQTENQSLISINSASAQELDTLPRIGAVTAQKIIDGRPYSNIEELVIKSVIGDSLFDEIQSLVKL